MGLHEPSVIWPLKKWGIYPQAFIQTADTGHLDVDFFDGASETGVGIRLTRRDARLLAKRLNQCLDETAG